MLLSLNPSNKSITYVIDEQLDWFFHHFWYWNTFYLEMWHRFSRVIFTQTESTGAVCLLLVCRVLSRINRDTVAGRGTALQSHAPRQLRTHACTHTHTRAQPQSSCRDALTKGAQKHWHASGGGHTFQLMSGSFSALTAKVCLPVCGFQKETLTHVCVCPATQQVTWASNVSYINIYDTLIFR